MGSVSFDGMYCCTVGLKIMYFCVISPKNVMFNYVAVFLPVQYNDRRNFLNSGPMHELTGN